MDNMKLAKELIKVAKDLVGAKILWKKNVIEEETPESGTRYEYVGGGYTIDVMISGDKRQGHPGSNHVAVYDDKGYVHGGTKALRTVKDVEKYVNDIKGKLERGESGKRQWFK